MPTVRDRLLLAKGDVELAQRVLRRSLAFRRRHHGDDRPLKEFLLDLDLLIADVECAADAAPPDRPSLEAWSGISDDDRAWVLEARTRPTQAEAFRDLTNFLTVKLEELKRKPEQDRTILQELAREVAMKRRGWGRDVYRRR